MRLIFNCWIRKTMLMALAGCMFFLLASNCAVAEENKTVVKTTLNEEWKLYPGKKITKAGNEISQVGYNDNSWHSTDVPSTVMAALIKNGVYKNVFMGDNLERIDTAQFDSPWWYRKEFTPIQNKTTELIFNGINYKANIWVNGQLIADSKRVEGVFRTYRFDITDKLVDGKNCIAVELIPPMLGDLTIGFVDWNPTPNDDNMGLWRGVDIEYSDAVSMKHSAVLVNDVDTKTFKDAELNIRTTLKNHTNKSQLVVVNAEIEDVKITHKLLLKANEEKVLSFDKNEFDQLVLKNPRLWWPNGMGEQNLYNMDINVVVDGKVSDYEKVRFGIRKIESYRNANGHTGYIVNGKKVLIKSAGWVDDIFLSDSDDKVKAQMLYAKNMNLNSIRLEGFWGSNSTIYDCADEYGILIMVGFSCHWEWKGYCGREETGYLLVNTERDIEVQGEGYRDQVYEIRNHPSLFLYVLGSDMMPTIEFEQALYDYIKPLDTTRPFLVATKHADFDDPTKINTSKISGTTGVKMLGPYGYVPPKYWFEDTRQGGAYGFNTETGPGPQIPPIESIRKMIPEKDLWPLNKMWDYHSGRNEFQTLSRYIEAFNNRYGESDNVEDFAKYSQLSNYEAMRGMYEAFKAYRPNSTGVVNWMLNSAWPEFFWQLYDWYLMPNGAFYATQDACRPLNIIYNYSDNDIYISNELIEDKNNLDASIKVFDIDSKVLFEKKIKFDVAENTSKKIFELPEIKNLSETYFLDLRVYNSDGKEIIDNFYWLSTKEEVMDYEKAYWVYTPIKEFTNYKQLRTMPKVSVEAEETRIKQSDKTQFTIRFKNNSDKIAFGIESLIVDEKTGESILPVFFNDNYFSLLPGESREIKAEIFNKNLNGKTPVFKYNGINLEK